MVTSVNASWIFITENGIQDKKRVTKEKLVGIHSEALKNMHFYERMMEEIDIVKEMYQEKEKETENRMECLETKIKKNKHKSLVKRGLADICFQYESEKEKMRGLLYKEIGIMETWQQAFKRYEHARKLYQESEGALRNM